MGRCNTYRLQIGIIIIGLQGKWIDFLRFLLAIGFSQHAVAPYSIDAVAHEHHAGDWPMIFAIAGVVFVGASEIRSHEDDNSIFKALAFSLLNQYINPLQKIHQTRVVVLIVITVYIESSHVDMSRGADAGFIF